MVYDLYDSSELAGVGAPCYENHTAELDIAPNGCNDLCVSHCAGVVGTTGFESCAVSGVGLVTADSRHGIRPQNL